jgi:Kef-type K+ transport system membrane component KefB
MRFDLDAVAGDPSALVLYLALFLVVRGVPTYLLARRRVAEGDRRALALYASTGLPLIVAITTLGLDAGKMPSSTAAALVGAGMVSVLVYPFAAGAMRRS